MNGYKRIKQDSYTELIINKSKFLGFAYIIDGAESAEDYINALRKRYNDATHVCYGYVADTLGNVARFSDDGEPQGTAGMPILDVIKKRNLRQTLVAVVRYFGGIKLGAGGLTRAYSQVAARTLDEAVEEIIKEKTAVTLCLDYAVYAKAENLLMRDYVKIIDKSYGDKVTLRLAVDKSEYDNFINMISSALGISGNKIIKGMA